MRKSISIRIKASSVIVSIAVVCLLFGPLTGLEARTGAINRPGWFVAPSDGTFFRAPSEGIWINDFGGPFPGYMLTGDFDGDGKADIAGWNGDVAGWHVAISTGQSFDPGEASGGGFWIRGFGAPSAGFMLTGDFNGDGKTDIAGWNGDISGWHVAVSTGHSFEPGGEGGGGFWIEGFGAPSAGFMLTGDFNGDGKTDIAGWNGGISGWHVAISTGHSFDPSESAGGGFWINGFGNPSAGFMLTGDFNGDGKTDIAGWNRDILGWHVAVSTGHTFDSDEAGGGGFWIEGFGGPSAGFMLTGDFNGRDSDGKNRTDIAGWNRDVEGFHIAISTGGSFDPGPSSGGGFWRPSFGRPSSGFMLVGDFDGDGRTDIARWNSLRPPAAPDGLRVINVGLTFIEIDWVDEADNEAGFQVHFAGGGFIDATRRIDEANTTHYILSGITPGHTYHISVTAFNAAGESDRSEGVVAATLGDGMPPSTPLHPFFFKVVCTGNIFTYCTTLRIYAVDAQTAKREAEQTNGSCTVTEITEEEFLRRCD